MTLFAFATVAALAPWVTLAALCLPMPPAALALALAKVVGHE